MSLLHKYVLVSFITGLLAFTAFSQENNLKYTTLNQVGLDTVFIYKKVDSLITLGIKEKAFPGAQLLVAYKGEVVFFETYGYHTYDSIRPVLKTDLYDLASVTKILGPLPALMKLYEEGKLNLDVPFSTYWPSWKHKKNKKQLTLREILAHQAGLEPYIVFAKKVKPKKRFKKRFIRPYKHKNFPLQAYTNLFVSKRFNKKIYRKIKRSKVSKNKEYKYSGLSFLIYPKLIENLTGKSYENYITENFYKPLGCNTLVYNPAQKGLLKHVVPTEIDTLFRNTLVKGWVHDENAALMGGLSGNAGLFGNAQDVAKIMIMYVQYGKYNTKRYLKEQTVKAFTKIQFPENKNRRGLGFDKPLINNDTLPLQKAYPAPEVSPESFGHAGFTGTFVWADPKYQLVFVLLSNRVYPYRSHRKLYELNLRPALQQVFYKALLHTSN